jgi:hypothetical protein
LAADEGGEERPEGLLEDEDIDARWEQIDGDLGRQVLGKRCAKMREGGGGGAKEKQR